MKVTHDVIIDLLPLYFSGEASEDTKSLVENYFEQNPEFANQVKNDQKQFSQEENSITLNGELEIKSLKKTKKLIKLRSFLLGFAIFFTLAPASVANIDGTTYWLAVEAPLTALGYGLVGVVFWISYFVTRYKIRTSGL